MLTFAITFIVLFNAFGLLFIYGLRSQSHNSLAIDKRNVNKQTKPFGKRLQTAGATKNPSEQLRPLITKILERLRTCTKLELLLFWLCVYYGETLLIFKTFGI